jgi:predicted nucleotidyltransferase
MNGEQNTAVAMLTDHSELKDGMEILPSGSKKVSHLQKDIHWQWRLRNVEKLAAQLDPLRFGVKALYIFGSVKNALAGPASDIDVLIHFTGKPAQRKDLLSWLEGWSLALSQINFLRTGYKTNGLLDVHIITDEDIANKDSYALKIGAVSDPARPLPIGTQMVG